MEGSPRTVKVTPGGELDRLLDEIGSDTLLLERNGKLYRLAAEDSEDIWANYDPSRIRAALAEVAGSLDEAEANMIIANIYRWREEGSRPFDRPYRWFSEGSDDMERGR